MKKHILYIALMSATTLWGEEQLADVFEQEEASDELLAVSPIEENDDDGESGCEPGGDNTLQSVVVDEAARELGAIHVQSDLYYPLNAQSMEYLSTLNPNLPGVEWMQLSAAYVVKQYSLYQTDAAYDVSNRNNKAHQSFIEAINSSLQENAGIYVNAAGNLLITSGYLGFTVHWSELMGMQYQSAGQNGVAAFSMKKYSVVYNPEGFWE